MIKLRPYLFCFIVCYSLFLAITPVNAESPETLSLERAVIHSISVNPGLAAMNAKAMALADLSAQKGSLPDPRLTLKMANLPLDSFSNTQENMTQMQIGLSQTLPYPGKLALREKVATIEGEAAVYEVEEQRLKLVRDVKTVWWNLYYLNKAMETVDRNQELQKQFVSIAQTKYQVGKGLQQDVLLAQLELSKLLEVKLKLENMRHNEENRLKVLLDFPIEHTITLQYDIEILLPEPASLASLMAQANNNRPLLTGLRKRLEAARLKIDLAEKDYYPDFTLGATYGYRDGENPNGTDRADFGTVMLSMNLPFFSDTRNDQALSQRSKEKLAQELTLKNSRKQIEAEVSNALFDFRSAADEVSLFKQGIIPQAKQTVDSMLSGYQVNTVDFLNLIRAQTSLYNYETRYWKAFSSAKQALARLIAAVGKEEIYE